jgi:4-amino-4-deoxy-L-arabinose transferase-like glycosyltransferase
MLVRENPNRELQPQTIGKRYSKLITKPFVLFAPFLILYIIVIIVFRASVMKGDESRYLIYAQYMINGFIPKSEIGFDTLANGPGYSIFLVPFVGLGVSAFWITLLNAFFYYFSIVLLFKSLRKIVSLRITLICSFFWALYFNLYESILLILPETFTTFLISLLIYCTINVFKKQETKLNKYVYISGLLIGYIALTKPIFGYVMFTMLIACTILYITKRTINFKRSFTILFFALLTTIPYLSYTYHVTNKIFYWSTVGGNNMYWMSNPYKNEYGDWFPDPEENADSTDADSTSVDYHIRLNHLRDFKEINKTTTKVERDEAFKALAIHNMKSHPVKYIQNCISNLGRIFFNYPYSYRYAKPRTLVRLPFNGILSVLILVCLIPALKNWNKINFEIRFLSFFALIYLIGSIFGSAETRMFTVIAPVILICIAFIIQRTIKMKLSW